MSQYYHYNTHHQQPTSATASAVSHNHHGGRNRRAPRLSVSQNQSHKQFRGVRSMKELPTESPAVTSFRRTFELGRSFDLDDDLDFVPGLITESDVSICTRARFLAVTPSLGSLFLPLRPFLSASIDILSSFSWLSVAPNVLHWRAIPLPDRLPNNLNRSPLTPLAQPRQLSSLLTSLFTI